MKDVKCIECSENFNSSFLRANFGYKCCDRCRDPRGKHDLITRTDAKREFGVNEADLLRKPKLRCIKKRNRFGTMMQLYLKIHVEQRAAESKEYAEVMEKAKELVKEAKKNANKQPKVKTSKKQTKTQKSDV